MAAAATDSNPAQTQERSAPERKTFFYRARQYDVTRWIPRHPGGDVITPFLDQDVTCVMNMYHDTEDPKFQKILASMDMGPAEDHPVSDFDKDYLELQERFRERGWYEPSVVWYAYKIAIVIALLVAAYAVPHPVLKGILFGLFIQQGAFIAHDACHNSVFPERFRTLGCWLFCDVCFGISHEFWTRDHNLHHLITNRPLADPQINNMPDLLYSAPEVEIFERTRRKLTDGEKLRMATQHIWLVPVLLLYARFNIVRNDVKRAIRRSDWQYLPAFGIHMFLWLSLLAQGGGALGWSLAFVATGLAVSGLLHIQLLLSHVYAPRHTAEEQKDLGMQIQIVSNQNITTTPLDDWFHGGLQHHIEHHLFPRLTRHTLPKARAEVRELCEKHGLEYKTNYFPRCVYDMLRGLARHSAPLREELWERHRPAAFGGRPS